MNQSFEKLMSALSPLLLTADLVGLGDYRGKSNKNDKSFEQSEESAAEAKNRAEMKREKRRLKRIEIQKRKEQKS